MNPVIRWPDAGLPLEICCATGVLSQLEMAAVDGLLAMPRVGLGVGGLLLGRRSSGRVGILRTVEVSCSHAAGPGFGLTAEELASVVARLPELCGTLEVVGWYCSKTGGQAGLSEGERALFESLCPGEWQAGLMIWPSRTQPTVGAFGFRGKDGFVVGARHELAWQELAPFEFLELAVEPGPELAPEPIAQPELAPEPTPDEPGVPVYAAPPERPGRKSGALRILTATALLIVAATVLGAAAFFTRDYWRPAAALDLIAAPGPSGRVLFLWNVEAIEPERDHATLIVDDGAGVLHTAVLNRKALWSGWMVYECRPGKVIATLIAGPVMETATVRLSPPQQMVADPR